MTGSSALTAGFMLILVSAACTAAGIAVGHVVGSSVLGGFAGGALGIVAGFLAVWRIYVVPMREASLAKDYSHLTPRMDEDE